MTANSAIRSEPAFRRGQSVVDRATGRVGKVIRSTRKVVLVSYPNMHFFLSGEVVYRKPAHAHLSHYDPNAVTEKALASL